jgi:ADP-ribose pyrophosphatase YjhB (NUDIX family)
VADILFKAEGFVFSYRVAGLVVRDGKVLLQKPLNDNGYAVPGGHLGLGETAAEALAREFLEETGLKVRVGRLMAAGEVFFPWGEKPCHQIGLYFEAQITGGRQVPPEGSFRGVDELGGERIDLDFVWVPLAELDSIKLYPPQIRDVLRSPSEGAAHFVYRETEG